MAPLDDALAADAAERLAHDRRTAHLGLEVAGSGAVLHVTGEVGDAEERGLVRRLLRGIHGVHAVWDLLWLPGQELRVADVGCGATKQVPQALGVDAVEGPGVDVVADLDDGLPFDDATLDHVFAVHVLEHVRDMLAVMRELHRVLRPGGVLHALCPRWTHVNAVADPTHRRGIDVQTFKYFTRERPGVPLAWRPLMVTGDRATVHADLEPAGPGEPPAAPAALARWFG